MDRDRFIHVIIEVEELLAEAGYTQSDIEQLEADAYTIARLPCTREDFILALDKLITSELIGILPELN